MKVENIKVQLVGELHEGTSSTTGKSWANRNKRNNRNKRFQESQSPL